jgi:hypothetical protein
MMQHEKDRLLTLLGTSDRWCQHAEARDRRGDAVHYDDPAAIAWDLTGAVCVLFGWARALELFAQLERQIAGRKPAAKRAFALQNNDPQICSMVAVQEFNDDAETTYELVIARLGALSVYHPELRLERAGKTP